MWLYWAASRCETQLCACDQVIPEKLSVNPQWINKSGKKSKISSLNCSIHLNISSHYFEWRTFPCSNLTLMHWNLLNTNSHSGTFTKGCEHFFLPWTILLLLSHYLLHSFPCKPSSTNSIPLPNADAFRAPAIKWLVDNWINCQLFCCILCMKGRVKI